MYDAKQRITQSPLDPLRGLHASDRGRANAFDTTTIREDCPGSIGPSDLSATWAVVSNGRLA